MVPKGIFAGISRAKPKNAGGSMPWAQPGKYIARIDTMKFGVADGKGKAPRGSVYVVIEMTSMMTLEDREGHAIPSGGEMQLYYSNARYPESFLSDIADLFKAYFGMSDADAANVTDEEWEVLIAEACQPEQILKGALLELRVFMNRKGSFTKTKWERRILYSDLRTMYAGDAALNAARVRWCSDEEIQRQIAKEVAEQTAS